MLRSFLATVVLTLAASSLQAEIIVENSGNDLRIRYQADSSNYMEEYELGHHIRISEAKGMVRIRSMNGLRVNGQSAVLFPFPADDIIVDVRANSQWGNSVVVEHLSLTGRSDDLRMTVLGHGVVEDVQMGSHSHSSLVMQAEVVRIEDVYARDQIVITPTYNASPYDISLRSTGAERRVWIQTSRPSDVLFQNCWFGESMQLRLSDYQDNVVFTDYVGVDGHTDILLGGGSDIVDIEITDPVNSTLGDAFMDGESGSDKVYQNVLWFNHNNTNSVEWFK